jgi:glycosyltransferase involved in cell wall biosynthesis
MTRRKVLLVQPSMQPPGGGNGVAAWMLHALAPVHDVTVLSWWPIELDPINRFYGTSLAPGEFQTRVVPQWWVRTIQRLPVPAALFRNGLLMRYTRRFVHEFDVVLGAHNEFDYGKRGIQYIHYPTYFRPRPVEDLRWYHHVTPLLRAYYFVADSIAGFATDAMKANVTLVNSDWTGVQVKRFLGIESQTLYPPVAAPGPAPRWEQRRSAFVAVGRISPEKEWERVIRIVAAVKRHEPEVTLTIVGTHDARTASYYASLHALCQTLDPDGNTFVFRQNLSREALRELLAQHRYGIHGMRREHFGMAPAEMALAGMIVWVADDGGQTEIVGDARALTYASEHDAVEKIVRVLRDEPQQLALRTYLADRAQLFSTDNFVRQIRTVVSVFE